MVLGRPVDPGAGPPARAGPGPARRPLRRPGGRAADPPGVRPGARPGRGAAADRRGASPGDPGHAADLLPVRAGARAAGHPLGRAGRRGHRAAGGRRRAHSVHRPVRADPGARGLSAAAPGRRALPRQRRRGGRRRAGLRADRRRPAGVRRGSSGARPADGRDRVRSVSASTIPAPSARRSRDASLLVGPGEMVALAGASGSGQVDAAGRAARLRPADRRPGRWSAAYRWTELDLDAWRGVPGLGAAAARAAGRHDRRERTPRGARRAPTARVVAALRRAGAASLDPDRVLVGRRRGAFRPASGGGSPWLGRCCGSTAAAGSCCCWTSRPPASTPTPSWR